MGGPGSAAQRQQDQLADRDAAGIFAELGNPPDSFAAPDRWQWRQLPVFAGQGQHVRRVDRRGGNFDQRVSSSSLVCRGAESDTSPLGLLK
jgi:hypothetical protein